MIRKVGGVTVMRKKPRGEAEESLNKIFEVISEHIASLPEPEAEKA